MDDKVNVDYPKLEEWFSQKQPPSVLLKPENSKAPLTKKHSTSQEVYYVNFQFSQFYNSKIFIQI
jgi:hypothetical protein